MKKSLKALVLVMCLAICAAFTACDKEHADSGSEASQDESSTAVSAAVDSLPTVSDMITDDTSSVDATDDTSSEAESDDNGAQAYSEVLASYKKVIDSIVDGTFDLDTALDDFPYINENESYKWRNMLGELSNAYKYTYSNLGYDLGYALYDIDKDGTDELFLINREHDISAIFTLIDGEVQFLDAYWARYYAILCDDNTVFTHGTGSVDSFEDVLYKLSEGKLVEILSFGCERGNYYKVMDGERSDITQEEYFSQSKSYEKNNNEVLEFIAV